MKKSTLHVKREKQKQCEQEVWLLRVGTVWSVGLQGVDRRVRKQPCQRQAAKNWPSGPHSCGHTPWLPEKLIKGQQRQFSQTTRKINTPLTCGSYSILQHRNYYFQLKPTIISWVMAATLWTVSLLWACPNRKMNKQSISAAPALCNYHAKKNNNKKEIELGSRLFKDLLNMSKD